MYYIYILKSQKHGRYYVGSSNDIEKRLKRHNASQNKSTKSGAPWTIVYSEEFLSRQDAVRRELQIKKYKGGEAFKKLVK